MVLCPTCGKEYSLGRIICHNCKGTLIFHGVVCSEKPKSHPWNCEDKKKENEPEINIKEILEHIYSYLNILKSCLS